MICYITKTTLKFGLSFNKKIYLILTRSGTLYREFPTFPYKAVPRTLRCRTRMADKSVDEEGDGAEGDHRQIRP